MSCRTIGTSGSPERNKPLVSDGDQAQRHCRSSTHVWQYDIAEHQWNRTYIELGQLNCMTSLPCLNDLVPAGWEVLAMTKRTDSSSSGTRIASVPLGFICAPHRRQHRPIGRAVFVLDRQLARKLRKYRATAKELLAPNDLQRRMALKKRQVNADRDNSTFDDCWVFVGDRKHFSRKPPLPPLFAERLDQLPSHQISRIGRVL